MKRLLALLLTFILMFTLVACGGNETPTPEQASPEPETAPQEEVVEEPVVVPLDLTGTWLSDNYETSDTYIMAEIRQDGKIGVFFKVENDDMPWTYWVGTYDAPAKDTDTYKWTSKNIYTGNGLLASTAESKEFNYHDEQIDFELTIQGDTGTIHLVRADWDTSVIPSEVYASATAVDPTSTDIQNIEVVNSGFTVDRGYVHYAVELKNPNTDKRPEFATIKLVGKDANGGLVFSDEWVISNLLPNTTSGWASQAGDGNVPDDVQIEFSVLVDEDKWKTDKEYPQLYQFSNTNVTDSGMGLKAIGEITLLTDEYKAGNALHPMVVCILKDDSGKIVGGFSTFLYNDLKVNEPYIFDFSSQGINPEYTTAEFYANPWY